MLTKDLVSLIDLAKSKIDQDLMKKIRSLNFKVSGSIPENVQLNNYIVDNSGFRIDAISSDLLSANKLISLLMENKLIDNKSMKINQIINQVNNSEPSMIGSSSRPIDSISIVISGDLVYLPLEDRIQSYKESDNYGNIEKLTNFFELLKLIR